MQLVSGGVSEAQANLGGLQKGRGGKISYGDLSAPATLGGPQI